MNSKKLAFLFPACIVSITMFFSEAAYAQDKAEVGIQFFHGTFAELKAKAASSSKPIFMDAYTSWCGPCKWMAKNVFTQEEVGKFYNGSFICAKVDMEKGEGVELAKIFDVNAYPTLLYLDASGKVIHRALGARDGKDFIELGKIAADSEKNLQGLERKYKAAPGDFSVAFPYLFMLSDAGLPQLDSEVDAWFSAQPKNSWIEKNNWKLLYDFIQNPESPAFQNMVSNMAAFSSRYSEDSVSGKACSVYFSSLQNAAYSGNSALWKKDSAAIVNLNLKDGKRTIASSTILQAGDDIKLALSRTMDFMKEFGSENPSELNQFAWKMFEASEDSKQLLAAESWAKKGLDLSGGDFMIHDTYANLLFKNKKYGQAREEAKKAIANGLKNGQDVSPTENLLKEIEMTSVQKPAQKQVPKAPAKGKSGKK